MQWSIVIVTVGSLCIEPMVAESRVADQPIRSEVVPNKQSSAAEQVANHREGNQNLGIAGNGTLGRSLTPARTDFRFGDSVRFSNEFPRGTSREYLFAGGLWVGAVRDSEFLVSSTHAGLSNDNEYRPLSDMSASMDCGSLPAPCEMITTSFTDTGATNSSHTPLGILVRQESMAWSHPAFANLVIVRYWIKNIGTSLLDSAYIGLYYDSDVGFAGTGGAFGDDIAGALDAFPVDGYCGAGDTVSLVWIADNDGDPQGGYGSTSVTAATALTVLDGPGNQRSYNWWSRNFFDCYDIGPRHVTNTVSLGSSGSGSPRSELGRYHILSNGEIDISYARFLALAFDTLVWSGLPEFCGFDIYSPSDIQMIASAGPFTLQPGDSVPFAVAVAMVDNFHTDPSNYSINWPNQDPDAFESKLDFDALASVCWLAREMYNGFSPLDSDRNGVGDLCQCSGYRDDCNGDGNAGLTVGDLTYLVAYLFRNIDGPRFPLECDTNGDGQITISDLTYSVGYIFQQGPPPALCP